MFDGLLDLFDRDKRRKRSGDQEARKGGLLASLGGLLGSDEDDDDDGRSRYRDGDARGRNRDDDDDDDDRRSRRRERDGFEFGSDDWRACRPMVSPCTSQIATAREQGWKLTPPGPALEPRIAARAGVSSSPRLPSLRSPRASAVYRGVTYKDGLEPGSLQLLPSRNRWNSSSRRSMAPAFGAPMRGGEVESPTPTHQRWCLLSQRDPCA
jgi:hypothetical protein